MITKQKIRAEIQDLNALRTLVRAYEEIASVRMKKTRDSVLWNRFFIENLNSIFEEVRASYIVEMKKLAKKRRKAGDDSVTFLSHNGKTVCVFLSANTGLYGGIIQATFDNFMKEVKERDVEVTIIGRHGLSLFLEVAGGHPYTYFDMTDQNVDQRQMGEIIKHLVKYEEIHVYYGEFVNAVTQKPSVLSVSAEVSLKEDEQGKKVTYIFEPTLEEILRFFETETFASLFSQTVSESQLAKFASRVLAMDKAEDNIKRSLKSAQFESLKIRHHAANRRQTNSLAGILISTQ